MPKVIVQTSRGEVVDVLVVGTAVYGPVLKQMLSERVAAAVDEARRREAAENHEERR